MRVTVRYNNKQLFDRFRRIGRNNCLLLSYEAMLNPQSIMLQLSGKAKQQNTTQMWIQELSQFMSVVWKVI